MTLYIDAEPRAPSSEPRGWWPARGAVPARKENMGTNCCQFERGCGIMGENGGRYGYKKFDSV